MNRLLILLALVGVMLLQGCAALSNPVGEAIPVRKLPSELLAPSKTAYQTIPLSLLGQAPPEEHILGPGDVLGVVVDDRLGSQTEQLPVHVGSLVQDRNLRRFTPSMGYPVVIQGSGEIHLPLIDPIQVTGLTLKQAASVIQKKYTTLNKEQDRVVLTLIQPRQHQIIVMRQESSNFNLERTGLLSTNKRGTGHIIELSEYENDLLHALGATGGLPGIDAYNEIVIFRGCFNTAQQGAALLRDLEHCEPLNQTQHFVQQGGQVIRIPLRYPEGVTPQIKPNDVILRTGDVVFIEAREEDVFYTAGLLPPGAQILPRDHDLDVIEAIARVQGSLVNGAFGGSNLSGTLIAPGIGNPSPSNLVVLRRTANGGQVPILVDLTRALQDPQSRERILVQAGDVLILQEKPSEAFTRYFTQTFLNVNLAWEFLSGPSISAILDFATPDRLTDRLFPPRNR